MRHQATGVGYERFELLQPPLEIGSWVHGDDVDQRFLLMLCPCSRLEPLAPLLGCFHRPLDFDYTGFEFIELDSLGRTVQYALNLRMRSL
jgi:hypothetical protein